MSDDDIKLVTIKTFSSRIEADLAKSVLESRGIDAEVQADDCGGMHTAMTYTIGNARLIVREEDAEVALKLLEEEDDTPAD